MERDVRLELFILQSVKNIGIGTLEEVAAELKDSFNETTDKTTLERILERWKAKKVLTQVRVKTKSGSKKAWKIADLPWYPVVDMTMVRELGPKEAKKILDELEERAAKMPRGRGKPQIRFYPWCEITFECIDPILGGRPTTDGKTEFPKINGTPYIPTGWWKGYLRSNGRLADIPEAHAIYRTAYSIGIIENGTKLINLPAQTKNAGPQLYEALPAGTRIRMLLRFPMQGSSITSPEELLKFFRKCSIAPIRGLGANPYAYGGRIKPIKFKVLKDNEVDLKAYEKIFVGG